MSSDSGMHGEGQGAVLPVKAASAGADGGTNVPTHGRPPARAGMRGSPDSGVLASLSAGWSAARRASAASRARGAALASPFQAGSLSILDVYDAEEHAGDDDGDAARALRSLRELDRDGDSTAATASHSAHQPLEPSSIDVASDIANWHRRLRTVRAPRACMPLCSCTARLCAYLERRYAFGVSNPWAWLYLAVLGFISAIAGWFVDGAAATLASWRLVVVGADVDGSLTGVGSFFVWVLWAVAFALLSAATGHLGTRDAEGSGIPELRSLLSGTPDLSRFLTLRVGVAKVIGVIAALAAGLSVGKEGPFVHVAAIAAHHLCRLPFFNGVRRNRALRRQMLAAAVASGVTAVFGAPVGGVLFSIEVTASYFLVSGLWRSFVCSVVCVATLEVINVLRDDELFDDTAFASRVDASWELLSFAALGGACGLLSAAFVMLLSRVLALRQELQLSKLPKLRYLSAAVVAVLCGSVSFMSSYLRAGDHDVINALFSSRHFAGGATDVDDDAVPSAPTPDEERWELMWGLPSPFVTLFLWLFLRGLLTPLSIALPIPCGLFTPLFALGACFGRLWGEIAHALFPTFGIVPGAYAVVGAAALTSGATHTLSTSVIVFELTGQLHHMLPVLVAVLVAYAVAGTFAASVYDVLLALRGIPYLPRVHGAALYDSYAKDVMRRYDAVASAEGAGPAGSRSPTRRSNLPILTTSATYADAVAVLTACTAGRAGVGPDADRSAVGRVSLREIPLVDDLTSMTLLGSVARAKLAAAVSGRRRRSSTRKKPREQRALLTDVDDDDTVDGAGGRSAGGDSTSAGPMDAPLRFVGMSSRGVVARDELPVDPAPFAISELTPLARVHFLFAVCQFGQVLVTRGGKLVGLLTKADLGDAERLLHGRRMRRAGGTSPQSRGFTK